jgi:hypothetical protein
MRPLASSERYPDFGPTLAAEKLAELHDIIVCRARRSDSRLLPSLSRATPSAVSEQFSELIGCPISKSLTTCCISVELRSLPSTGVTRLQRYCEPLRHPKAPGPPRYGSRLGLHTSLSPIRDTLIEGFSHFVTSMTAPIASGWRDCRMGFAPTGKRGVCTAQARNGHSRIVRDIGPDQV